MCLYIKDDNFRYKKLYELSCCADHEILWVQLQPNRLPSFLFHNRRSWIPSSLGRERKRFYGCSFISIPHRGWVKIPCELVYAVTSSQFPQVDNRLFFHKMTFRVVPSLVQSRWLKHGYVCLSPPVLHKEMDLTIFMDINPNPEPPNCLSCLYLNARRLKVFVPSSVDPSVKVCKISKFQDLVYTGILWSGLYLRKMA